MKLLDGKVIAITGAGGGLGRAYALELARRGAKLVINDVGGALDGTGGSSAMADAVVADVRERGGEAVANHSSVATLDGAQSIVQSAVDAFGRLDVLINNAGILRDKTLLKMDEPMWDEVIAVHLKGTFACSKAAAAQMCEQESGGAIINTTSYAGLKGNYGQTNYAAAKAGIYGMTLVHAQELSRYKIRVNAVAPMAKTRMTAAIAMIPDEMTAEHVVPMVVFLASDRAHSVNGRVFGVHGDHVFEYRMLMSGGVRGQTLSVEEIAKRLPEIAAGETEPTFEVSEREQATPAAPPADKVAAVFEHMPAGFRPERAKGWNGVLHWEIAGSGDFTLSVVDGKCTSAKGKVGEPTCVVKTDTETFLGIGDGSVDGQRAFMQGKITATNLGDMMKYQMAISGKKIKAAMEAVAKKQPASAPAVPPQPAAAAPTPAASTPTPAAPAAPTTPAEKVAAVFQYMPAGFRPERAKGWKGVLHWEIAGSGDFTLSVADGKCTSEKGKVGEPTCVVKTDTETFLGIGDGSVDGQQAFMKGKITATNLGDMMKYQGAISGKKIKAAMEAAAQGPAAKAPAAAPAAAASTKGQELLASLIPADRLRMLLGLLPDLVGDVQRTLNMHLKINDARGRELPVTVRTNDGALVVEAGHRGRPTSRLLATGAGLWELWTGGNARDLLTSGAVTATSMDELRWLLAAAGADPTAALAEELQQRGVGISPSVIGTAYHGEPLFVTEERMLAFARATNDPNPLHNEVGRKGGIDAPPLFPVSHFNAVYRKVIAELSLDFDRLLFGEMDLRFNAPVRAGDLVVAKCRILDIEDKESGQLVRIGNRLMCEGEAKAEGIATFFVRWSGHSRIRRIRSESVPPESTKRGVVFEEPMLIRAEQTKLFAEAADDPNPIHLDDAFAQRAGLPGRILHGLCSMSFCSQAFVEHICKGDPSRLKRLHVRFAKPARPGQTVTTRAFAPSERDGLKEYAFVAENDDGEQVITDGLAAIA